MTNNLENTVQREIKTIETPEDGVEVKIYTYLTGREKREITNIFLSSAKLSINGTDEARIKADNFDGSVMNRANDKAIELLVHSVNGKTENKLDAILNMKVTDYEYVLEQINIVQQGDKKKVKK